MPYKKKESNVAMIENTNRSVTNMQNAEPTPVFHETVARRVLPRVPGYNTMQFHNPVRREFDFFVDPASNAPGTRGQITSLNTDLPTTHILPFVGSTYDD